MRSSPSGDTKTEQSINPVELSIPRPDEVGVDANVSEASMHESNGFNPLISSFIVVATTSFNRIAWNCRSVEAETGVDGSILLFLLPFLAFCGLTGVADAVDVYTFLFLVSFRLVGNADNDFEPAALEEGTAGDRELVLPALDSAECFRRKRNILAATFDVTAVHLVPRAPRYRQMNNSLTSCTSFELAYLSIHGSNYFRREFHRYENELLLWNELLSSFFCKIFLL
jgi:hypothetical protein